MRLSLPPKRKSDITELSIFNLIRENGTSTTTSSRCLKKKNSQVYRKTYGLPHTKTKPLNETTTRKRFKSSRRKGAEEIPRKITISYTDYDLQSKCAHTRPALSKSKEILISKKDCHAVHIPASVETVSRSIAQEWL